MAFLSQNALFTVLRMAGLASAFLALVFVVNNFLIFGMKSFRHSFDVSASFSNFVCQFFELVWTYSYAFGCIWMHLVAFGCVWPFL